MKKTTSSPTCGLSSTASSRDDGSLIYVGRTCWFGPVFHHLFKRKSGVLVTLYSGFAYDQSN